MNFYSGNYCCLEIFARCKSGTQGGIKLLNKITNESQESTAGKYNYIVDEDKTTDEKNGAR